MTIEEIKAFRNERIEKEMEMWIELLNEKFPIGKVMEIGGEKMKVAGYGYRQQIPVVNFEKLVTQQTSVFYYNLPGFEEGGNQ